MPSIASMPTRLPRRSATLRMCRWRAVRGIRHACRQAPSAASLSIIRTSSGANARSSKSMSPLAHTSATTGRHCRHDNSTSVKPSIAQQFLGQHRTASGSRQPGEDGRADAGNLGRWLGLKPMSACRRGPRRRRPSAPARKRRRLWMICMGFSFPAKGTACRRPLTFSTRASAR